MLQILHAAACIDLSEPESPVIASSLGVVLCAYAGERRYHVWFECGFGLGECMCIAQTDRGPGVLQYEQSDRRLLLVPKDASVVEVIALRYSAEAQPVGHPRGPLDVRVRLAQAERAAQHGREDLAAAYRAQLRRDIALDQRSRRSGLGAPPAETPRGVSRNGSQIGDVLRTPSDEPEV